MMNSLAGPKVVEAPDRLRTNRRGGEEVTSYSPSTLHASINASCQMDALSSPR